MEKVKSPCIKVCKYDSKGVCFGCRRTKAEAANWPEYDNEIRTEVLKLAAERENVPGESPMGNFW